MSEKFNLPEIWKDDDEMYRLMQKIKRPRAIDPIGFDRKISFWALLIEQYAKHNRVLVLSENSLKEVFKRNFIHDGTVLFPECLPHVLNHMMETGVLQIGDQNNIISRLTEIGYEWVFKKPVSWAMSFILGEGSTGNPTDNRNYCSPECNLILHKFLADFTADFLNFLKKNRESVSQLSDVYILDDFESALLEFFHHSLSRDLIKKNLIQSRNVRLETSTSVKLAICSVDTSSLGEPQLNPIILSSIARLRLTARHISSDVEKLLNDISIRRNKIKNLLLEKRRSEALCHLRRNKHLEAEVNRKYMQLANLESLELKLNAAKDNQSVFRAISDASVALKATTGGAEGVTNAERTMDELIEMIEDTDVISTALESVSRDEQDSNLEEELNDLLGIDKKPKAIITPLSPKQTPSDKAFEDELDRQLRSLDLLTVNDLPEPNVHSLTLEQ